MADLLQNQDGFLRQADALLRATGGRSVSLRLPVPAVPNDDAEQLGLATPQFNDVEVGPAVFRRVVNDVRLVIAASGLVASAGAAQMSDVDALLSTAAGVVVDGVLCVVVETVALQTDGITTAYCLTLKRPVSR